MKRRKLTAGEARKAVKVRGKLIMAVSGGFRCWKGGVAYDESRYLEALVRRGSL